MELRWLARRASRGMAMLVACIVTTAAALTIHSTPVAAINFSLTGFVAENASPASFSGPIAGATVRVCWAAGSANCASTTTAADGSFGLGYAHTTAGVVSITVTAPAGSSYFNQSRNVTARTSNWVERFSLVTGARVNVNLFDPSGEPLEGRASFCLYEVPMGTSCGGTDAGTSFSVLLNPASAQSPNVVPGGYSIIATDELRTYATAVLHGVPLTPGTPTTVDLRFEPGTVVRGVVTSAGATVPSAYVVHGGTPAACPPRCGSLDTDTFTDEAGSFTLQRVPAGSQVLYVVSGGVFYFGIEAGGTALCNVDVAIAVPACESVSGIVTDPAAAPVPGAIVTLVDSSQPSSTATAQTDAGGRYAFPPGGVVDGGQYTVSVAPPTTRPDLGGATAPALTTDFGSPMARNVVLPAADPDDETPPTIVLSSPHDGDRYVVGDDVAVGYSCSDPDSGGAVVECAGRSSGSPDVVDDGAALSTSTPGTYTFTVNARDAAGNTSSAAVTYTVTAASVVGTVTDELGMPVAGMNMVLRNFPIGGTTSTLTGADGRYRFPSGAIAGSISVLNAYAPASRPDLRLESGAQVPRTSPPVVVDMVIPFKDIDGVADGIENAGPNGGDGNADGTPDAAQAHVVSLPNVVDGRYMTVQSPVGVRFQSTQSVTTSPPTGYDAPIGAVGYQLLVRAPGDTVAVTTTLPADLAFTEYRAVDETASWSEFPGVTINGGVVTLTLTDGGATDADGAANGVIVHRGGPLVAGGADADGDGIADALEPDPTASSSVFSDTSLTPPTTGEVIGAAGNLVAVTDADDPADGVRVTVSGGGGAPSVLEVCGLTVTLAVGSDATFTCGSLRVAVTAGTAEVARDGGSTRVALDAGDRALIAAPPDPFSVRNLGTSPVTVTVDGVAYAVESGRTLPGPIHHLVLSPATAVVPTRVAQPFTVRSVDQNGFGLGDVTASATLAIAPNGTCTASSCSASVVGVHTVTAALGGVTATATLDVRSAQTITFASLGTKTMVQGPITVAATASSGLPVSFSTTTPAVCTAGGTNGTTITFVAAGACTVRADQAGNAAYAAAAPVLRTFTINKATQSISFAALAARSITEGSITVVATASSGLTVTFSSTTPGVCATGGANGATVDLLSAGTCTVRAEQAGNGTHAAATPVVRSFTVSKVSQTISFPAIAGQTLAQPPTVATATASSGLVVRFTTTTPSVCTAGGPDGSIITSVAAGTCTVEATQPGDATYKAAPAVTRSFTVSKVTQTITFPTLSARSITDPPLTVAATASSGLVVGFTTTTPSVCTAGGPDGSTITLVAAGTCTVQATQPGDATYKAAPAVNRSFTVSKLAQTITFPAISAKSRAQSPIVVTATASSGLVVTFTTTTPTVCTVGGADGSIVTLVAAGTCTVRASQPGDATYAAAAAVNRSFKVT